MVGQRSNATLYSMEGRLQHVLALIRGRSAERAQPHQACTSIPIQDAA